MPAMAQSSDEGGGEAKEAEVHSGKKARRPSPKEPTVCQACGASMKPGSSPRKPRSPRSGEGTRVSSASADVTDTTDGDLGTLHANAVAEGGPKMDRLLAQLQQAQSLAAHEALCARDAALCHSAEWERRCIQLRDVFADGLEGLARLQAQELLESAERLAGRATNLGCGGGAPPARDLQSVEVLEPQLRDVEARLDQVAARLKGSLGAAGSGDAGAAKQDAKIVSEIMEAQQEVSALQHERTRVDALLLVAKLQEARSAEGAEAEAEAAEGQEGSSSKELAAMRQLLDRTRELCTEATAKLLSTAEENVRLTATLSKVQGASIPHAVAGAPSDTDQATGEESRGRRHSSEGTDVPQGEARRQQLLQQMSRAVLDLDQYLREEEALGPPAPGPSYMAPALRGGPVAPISARGERRSPRLGSPRLDAAAALGVPGEASGLGDDKPWRSVQGPDFPPPSSRPWTGGVAPALPPSPPDALLKPAHGPAPRRGSHQQHKVVLPPMKPRSPVPTAEADTLVPEVGPANPQPPLEPPRSGSSRPGGMSASVNID